MEATAQRQPPEERIANATSNFISSLPTDTEAKMFLITHTEFDMAIMNIQDAAQFYPRMKALSPAASRIRITLRVTIRNRKESSRLRTKLEVLARYPDSQTTVEITCVGLESDLGPLRSLPHRLASLWIFPIRTMIFLLSDITRQSSPVIVQPGSSSASGSAVLTPDDSSSTENQGQASSSSSPNLNQDVATPSTTSNDSVGGYDNEEDSGNDADDEDESESFYFDAMMAHRLSKAAYTIEGHVDSELEGSIGGDMDEIEDVTLLYPEVLDISHGRAKDCLCETCVSFLQNWHAWRMQGCLFRPPNYALVPWVH